MVKTCEKILQKCLRGKCDNNNDSVELMAQMV